LVEQIDPQSGDLSGTTERYALAKMAINEVRRDQANEHQLIRAEVVAADQACVRLARNGESYINLSCSKGT